MAKQVKIGYLDEEFRKTTIGRTTSQQQKANQYQKDLAKRLAVPSQYFEAAANQAGKAKKSEPVVVARKSGASRPVSAGGDVADMIRAQEFVGYSDAQSMTLLRRNLKNKPTGTKLGL